MRFVVVSNRLPFTVNVEDGKTTYSQSSGGIASSLGAYLGSLRKNKYLWVGWPGTDICKADCSKVKEQVLKQKNAWPVFLDSEVRENFYEGFCNKIIWPLFHYFTSYGIFNPQYWEDYKKVNEKYAQEVLKIIKRDDLVWVQDYQLMLVPKLLRQARPDLKIGFFLHIPFPSSEIFNILPKLWRKEILEGILGSDVVGFHTQDYTHHFLRSVLRILGFEHSFGNLLAYNRKIFVKTFPLGIDFNRFHEAVKDKEVIKEKGALEKSVRSYKVILSIDRLDYSKGIINRLRGYEKFLQSNPDLRKKVVLVVILVPSRVGVGQYQLMKKEIEEQIGAINGLYGSVSWTPILYHFGTLNFTQLIAHYNLADIALVTPLRDGMNLIAKEYIASKGKKDKGVLILSEKAGASKELAEAIIINPNSEEEIAEAIKEALKIPKKMQLKKIALMQKHLSEHDVFAWAKDFFTSLEKVKEEQEKLKMKQITIEVKKDMSQTYKSASTRLIFLDYDGTLSPYRSDFSKAQPTREVTRLLKVLAEDKKNEIVLISGRDRLTLEEWFGELPVVLVAEHGLLIKEKWAEWKLQSFPSSGWKKDAIGLLKFYSQQLPGSVVEEKDYSVAWHYRKADPIQAAVKSKELLDDLVNFTANKDLQVLHGNKVIEIKPVNTNKGLAGAHWIRRGNFDFILAIGDDKTDEDLFNVLPATAYSINVGSGQSGAVYSVKTPGEVIRLLTSLISR